MMRRRFVQLALVIEASGGWLLLTSQPAYAASADHCGSLVDCFGTTGAAIAAAVGLGLLIGLGLGLGAIALEAVGEGLADAAAEGIIEGAEEGIGEGIAEGTGEGIGEGAGGAGETGGGATGGAGEGAGGAEEGPWWNASNFDENWYGTDVPRSFNLEVGDQNYFVNPNATEHMAEYAFGAARNGISASGQFPISSLAGSVEQAQAAGLQVGRNFVTVGDWELGIDTNGNVIYHALFRP